MNPIVFWIDPFQGSSIRLAIMSVPVVTVERTTFHILLDKAETSNIFSMLDSFNNFVR